MTAKDRTRFWAKVDKTGPCWLWLAAVQSSGYGTFWLNGANRLAHRVSLVMNGVKLKDDDYALHADECISKLCVNPAHLRPGTQSENMQQHYRYWWPHPKALELEHATP